MIFSRQLDTTPKQYRERFRADDVPRIATAGERVLQSVPLGEAA
jgi:hypothetical protein